MKNTLLFILTISFQLVNAQSSLNWQTINLPYSGRVNSMLFVDSLEGYLTIENKLLKSDDGGNSWNLLDSLVLGFRTNNSVLYNLYNLNLKGDSLLMGASYYDSAYNVHSFLAKMHLDSNVLIADSSIQDQAILRSFKVSNNTYFGIDSNNAFIKFSPTISQSIFSNARTFTIEGNAIAVSYYNELYLSSDLGVSWDTINVNVSFGNNSPTEVVFKNLDTLILRYFGFPIYEYISFDRGINWQILDTLRTQRRPIDFVATSNGSEFVGNYRNLFLYSDDFGYTFFSDTINANTSQSFSLKTFISPAEKVFIYGDSGRIYTSQNFRTLTSLKSTKSAEFTPKLFPNPSSDVIKIDAKHCRELTNLSLINLKGQLELEITNPCEEIDVSILEPAVYILRGMYKKKSFSSKLLIH